MAKPQHIKQIRGLGRLYLSEAPLDEQLRELRSARVEYPISLRDASYARLHGGPTYATRTCHANILARNSPVIVARISPLVETLKMARIAVEAHSATQYPVFDKSVYGDIYGKWLAIAEKDRTKKPKDRRAFFLEQRGDHRIHKDSEQAMALWQDTREDYFNKIVRGDSVESFQVNPNRVDSQDGTIINYLWFDGVDGGSDLLFWGRVLDYDNRALGVLKNKRGR